MTRPYNRLRETTFDLYVERDTLPAYFRIITLLSTWLLYIGYILFALAFSVGNEHLTVSRTVLVALASALLIVGYLVYAVAAFFSRSLLFLIDGTLYPVITASLMGVLVTALTFGINNEHPVDKVYMAVPLITSSVMTLVSGVVLGLVYREVSKIKVRDERRRWHVAMGPYGTEQQSLSPNAHQRSTDGVEDDAQRRQLLRLLQGRQEQTSMDDTRGTYKIDLPGERRMNPLAWNTTTTTTAAAPRRSFHFSDLLSWNNSSSGTFKDARERRREEIERSGLSVPEGSSNSMWQSRSRSVSAGPQHRNARDPLPEGNQQNQSSTWGWPPVTRYA